MSEFVSIISIFVLFISSLAIVWGWFLQNEATNSKKITENAIDIYNSGKFEEAEKLLREALRISKENYKAQYYLGVINFKEKKFTEAKIFFETVLKHENKNINAKFWLANTEQALKNVDKAEAIYKEILKKNKKCSECKLQLGIIEYNKKLYFNAIDYFRQALESSSQKSLCSFYITKCKASLCQYETKEDAQDVIDEYLKLENEEERPQGYNFALAKLYAQTGQIDEAYNYCKKSLENNLDDIESYKLLSLIQLLKHDYDGAKKTLSTAVNLEPNNIEIHTILSYALSPSDTIYEVNKYRQKYGEIIKKFLESSSKSSNSV